MRAHKNIFIFEFQQIVLRFQKNDIFENIFVIVWAKFLKFNNFTFHSTDNPALANLETNNWEHEPQVEIFCDALIEHIILCNHKLNLFFKQTLIISTGNWVCKLPTFLPIFWVDHIFYRLYSNFQTKTFFFNSQYIQVTSLDWLFPNYKPFNCTLVASMSNKCERNLCGLCDDGINSPNYNLPRIKNAKSIW